MSERIPIVTHACGHRWDVPRSTPEQRVQMERDPCPTCGVGITVSCLSPDDAFAEACALVASFEGLVDTAANRAGLVVARRIRALVYRQATDGRHR